MRCMPCSMKVQFMLDNLSSHPHYCCHFYKVHKQSPQLDTCFFHGCWPLYAQEIRRNLVNSDTIVDITELIVEHMGVQMLKKAWCSGIQSQLSVSTPELVLKATVIILCWSACFDIINIHVNMSPLHQSTMW